MTTSSIDEVSRPRAAAVLVPLAAGWVVLLIGLGAVRPYFGVISPVTWSVLWLGWLCVIVVPATAAVRRARASRRQAMALAGVGALAVIALVVVRPPQLSPEWQFRTHRADFAVVAALADRVADGTMLPWPQRLLSIDGRVHVTCGETGPCVLYLPAWQDWRGESGEGFAYLPRGAGPGVLVVTAPGDMGSLSRVLGDGWWWVE